MMSTILGFDACRLVGRSWGSLGSCFVACILGLLSLGTMFSGSLSSEMTITSRARLRCVFDDCFGNAKSVCVHPSQDVGKPTSASGPILIAGFDWDFLGDVLLKVNQWNSESQCWRRHNHHLGLLTDCPMELRRNSSYCWRFTHFPAFFRLRNGCSTSSEGMPVPNHDAMSFKFGN
jgi:hypothetical protein